MRYLVRARVKPGHEAALLESIERQTLGQGSVAEGEYLRNMQEARTSSDGTARWVEVCYCPMPLLEERPYWEEFFDLAKVQDAHDRRKCRDENGSEPWACGDCTCTARLEGKLKAEGRSFLDSLRDAPPIPGSPGRIRPAARFSFSCRVSDFSRPLREKWAVSPAEANLMPTEESSPAAASNPAPLPAN